MAIGNWIQGALWVLLVSVAYQSRMAEAGKKEMPPKAVHVVGQHPPTYTCPNGYDRQDMMDGKVGCFRTLTFQPLRRCVDGIQKGDQCFSFAPVLTSCPEGFIPVSSYDKHEGHHASHHSLEYEYYDGHYGNDHMKKIHDGKGKHESVNGCIRIETESFEQVCPDGSFAGKSGCPWARSVPTYLMCPIESHSKGKHGKDHGGHHGHGGHSSHHQDGKHDSSPDDCLEYDSVNPLRRCPKEYVLDPKKGLCVGVQRVVCPRVEKHQPEPLCIGAHCADKNANIMPINHGAYNSQTWSGHRYLGKKHGEEDKKHKDTIIINKEPIRYCDEQIMVPAILDCPPGSLETTGSSGHGKDGKMLEVTLCVLPRKVPLIPYCPIPDGIMDDSGTHCTVHGFHKPRLQCPHGYDICDSKKHSHHGGKHGGDDLFNRECCRSNMGKPLISCPPGYALINDRCEKIHPFEYFCDKGQILENGLCIQQESAPPKIEYAVKLETKGKVIPPSTPPPVYHKVEVKHEEPKKHGGHHGHH